MNKNLLTNPITGKIIKNSSFKLLNIIKQNFESNYKNIRMKNKTYVKNVIIEENITDDEYLKKNK